MPLTIPPHKAEQRLLGQALRAIREARRPKPSLRDIGAAIGMTGAGYQQYELGERVFAPEKLEAIMAALQATDEELEAERARILGEEVVAKSAASLAVGDFIVNVLASKAEEGGEEIARQIDLRQVLGRAVAATEVRDSSLEPWAEPGEIVLFDRARHPRRGYGCVVELKTGELIVKLYSHTDGSTLFVKELKPEERTITYPLGNVRGVYAVRLRGD